MSEWMKDEHACMLTIMLFKTVQDLYSHTRCLGRHLWNCGMHEDNSLWGDIALLAEGMIKRQDGILSGSHNL